MALKYNNDQHKEYIDMTTRIGQKWIDVFDGRTEFYDATFWDLLTKVWYSDTPVRKTDALKFMTGIKSAHTAGKYVEQALAEDLLAETVNPGDGRSKLLTLSPRMRERLDRFFDGAISEVRKSNHEINVKGPSPEDP
jgi:hypothetical protein